MPASGVLAPPERTARRERRPRVGGPPPPGQGDGDGGGGDRGDGRGPDDDDDPRAGARAFGVRLALVGVTSLFVTFVALALALRRDPAGWPPPGTPPAPTGLWVSTLLLALSCATLPRATQAARARSAPPLERWLEATLALGLGFVGSQAWVWARLAGAGLLPSTSGYGALFYALTGLHAVHVLGGLAILGHLRWRARSLAERGAVQTVRLAGVYWHFMGLVWAVVLALVWAPGGRS